MLVFPLPLEPDTPALTTIVTAWPRESTRVTSI
jgi:hypothetical protein